jgi:hypothetical protein
VSTVAEWRSFGLLTLAQPYFLCFFGSEFEAHKMLLDLSVLIFGPALFVGGIAKGLFLAEPASTPGICFAGFYHHRGWFAFGRNGQFLVIHILIAF